MNILELKKNHKARILYISGDESLVKQIIALGIEVDTVVEKKYAAPFNGPICIKNNDKLIVVRKQEAAKIIVAPV